MAAVVAIQVGDSIELWLFFSEESSAPRLDADAEPRRAAAGLSAVPVSRPRELEGPAGSNSAKGCLWARQHWREEGRERRRQSGGGDLRHNMTWMESRREDWRWWQLGKELVRCPWVAHTMGRNGEGCRGVGYRITVTQCGGSGQHSATVKRRGIVEYVGRSIYGRGSGQD
jgi:hypothetical protein